MVYSKFDIECKKYTLVCPSNIIFLSVIANNILVFLLFGKMKPRILVSKPVLLVYYSLTVMPAKSHRGDVDMFHLPQIPADALPEEP